jgi:hypothetical protein
VFFNAGGRPAAATFVVRIDSVAGDSCAGRAGELLGDVERLRQEALDLAGARDGKFLIFAQFVHAENGDDVLQIFVSLQSSLHHLGDVVVFLTHDERVKNARSRSQRIDGRINPASCFPCHGRQNNERCKVCHIK